MNPSASGNDPKAQRSETVQQFIRSIDNHQDLTTYSHPWSSDRPRSY